MGGGGSGGREEITFDPKKVLHDKNQRASLKISSPYST